jgi:hypothetical protein
VDKKNVPRPSRLTVPGTYRGSGDESDAASASSMSTTATGVAAAVTEAREQKEQSKEDMEEIEINPGVILDARREVRAKLYMGQVSKLKDALSQTYRTVQVPMGWMWFIPAFHMAEGASEGIIQLTRKDVDFPLGVGAWIENIEIVLTRVEDESTETTSTPPRAAGEADTPEIRARDTLKDGPEPPSRVMSPQELENTGKGESGAGGLVHAMGRLMAGEGVGEAVDASQAAD